MMLSEVAWILGAVASWAGILLLTYRRSEKGDRVRGLLITLSWLVFITPAAYGRSDGDVVLTSLTSIGGALVFLLVSKGTFGGLLRQIEDRDAEVESDDDMMSTGLFLLIFGGPVLLLAILIFWP